MALADDAVHGVRMAEAIVHLEYVKTERDEFAALIAAMDYPTMIAPYVTEHVRRIRLRESNTAMLLFGWHM